LDESGPRPRRFYRLTSKGQKKLAYDTQQWQALWNALRSVGITGQRPAAGAAGGGH
jgi:DNA-binding PadR family transcriptional regulator